jgi:hypothetical protein
MSADDGRCLRERLWFEDARVDMLLKNVEFFVTLAIGVQVRGVDV